MGPVPPGGPERQNVRFGPRPPPSANPTSTENNAKSFVTEKLINNSSSIAQKDYSIPFSFRSFVEALGLPGNRQSEQLVTFARFFSLALQGTTLKQAQSEARALGGPWESALLALLSTASKGIRLKEDTLKSYIRAIDPSLRERKTGFSLTQPGDPGIGKDLPVEPLPEDGFASGDDGFANGDAGSKGSDTGTGEGTGGNADGRSGDNAEEGTPENGGAEPEGGKGKGARRIDGDSRAMEHLLAEKAGALLSGPGALAFLNRLKLSSNKKWLVLPFSFSYHNIDFELTVRLLYNEKGEENTVERMAMDLFFPPPRDIKGKARRWIFVLVNPITENSKLIVTREPHFSENEKRTYAKRVEAIVQPYAKRIFFEDSLKNEVSIDDPITLFTPMEERV